MFNKFSAMENFDSNPVLEDRSDQVTVRNPKVS